jgi:hypothetical protein
MIAQEQHAAYESLIDRDGERSDHEPHEIVEAEHSLSR